MKNLAVLALLAAFSRCASRVRAKRRRDPLHHFLASAVPERAKRVLDDGVARLSGDFNNDGLPDVALWQEADLGPDTGPVWLYLRAKTAAILPRDRSLSHPECYSPRCPSSTVRRKLFFCDWRGDQAVPAGYSLQGFIVADLPRAELPTSCAGADGAGAVCREACGEMPSPTLNGSTSRAIA